MPPAPEYFSFIVPSLLGLGMAVMSLLYRSCLNLQIGGVSLGFVPGLWERGREEEQPCVSGTAMFKAQAFYISTVETVKEFWHLSF